MWAKEKKKKHWRVPIAVAATNWMMCIAIAHNKRHPSSTDLIQTQQTQHQVLKNLSLSLSLSLSVSAQLC
jgi:hypothetical protein